MMVKDSNVNTENMESHTVAGVHYTHAAAIIEIKKLQDEVGVATRLKDVAIKDKKYYLEQYNESVVNAAKWRELHGKLAKENNEYRQENGFHKDLSNSLIGELKAMREMLDRLGYLLPQTPQQIVASGVDQATDPNNGPHGRYFHGR